MVGCMDSGAKNVVWAWWWVTSLTSACFGALSVSLFQWIEDLYENTQSDKSELFGILFSTCTTISGIAAYTLVSFFVLLSSNIFNGGCEFWKGFFAASTASLAVLCSYSGAVTLGLEPDVLRDFMQEFEERPAAVWSARLPNIFKTTSCFGFGSSFAYLVLTAILSFALQTRKNRYAVVGQGEL